MLLVTFSGTAGRNRLGVQTDTGVIDVGALAEERRVTVPATLLDVVRTGAGAVDAIAPLVQDAGAANTTYPHSEVQLHAPLRPGKIVGVGLNYTEHVAESARTLDTAQELPARPVLFSKPSTAVVGPGDPILHNGDLTEQLDWEVELAVVIGRTAKRVPESAALDYVFGYSIVNDISARDQRRSGQWFFQGAGFLRAVRARDPHRRRRARPTSSRSVAASQR